MQQLVCRNIKTGACGTVYDLSCIPKNINYTTLVFEDMLTMNGFTGSTKENLSNCP